MKPYIIGIAGESGVGKSTIADMLSLYFDAAKTLIISTDDLHKWERNNKKWQEFTHLNPEANNLELGDMHIESLANNTPIYRSVYNHNIGYFNAPIKIEPKATIIVEGLHAFYTELSRQLLDIKIFVDTDEDLRVHWKIIRDTEERGYTYNTALEAINRRRADGVIIRDTQITAADVIITLTASTKINRLGDRHEDVKLVVNFSFQNPAIDPRPFRFIENYIATFNDFKLATETIGKNVCMCQDGGGNISAKIDERYMFIKASGRMLKDAAEIRGHAVIDYRRQDWTNTDILASVASNKYKCPSMETGFHTLLRRHTIHAHPIYLTLILCLSDSSQIMRNLFGSLNYDYIPYVMPGEQLYRYIKSKYTQKQDCTEDVLFLENHGVIVAADHVNDAIRLASDIELTALNYLKNNGDSNFEEFSLSFADQLPSTRFTFPDAAVFFNDATRKETAAAHNYIISQACNFGKIRYLSENNVNDLRNSQSENYRKLV